MDWKIIEYERWLQFLIENDSYKGVIKQAFDFPITCKYLPKLFLLHF